MKTGASFKPKKVPPSTVSISRWTILQKATNKLREANETIVKQRDELSSLLAESKDRVSYLEGELKGRNSEAKKINSLEKELERLYKNDSD